MGNAIMSQIDKTYSLGELCDSAVAGSTNLGEEAPPV